MLTPSRRPVGGLENKPKQITENISSSAYSIQSNIVPHQLGIEF
jgi:hypothetical protein